MQNKCFRCGYTWGARSNAPLRCPSCKSTRWDKEVIEDTCLRCGAKWIQRGKDIPKYCPICHSSMWNSSKLTYTCPKCGKTRMLRSNSRMNLCPVCDVYRDVPKNTEFNTEPIQTTINLVKHIWRNGSGLTLDYSYNDNGTARLYDKGKLVGEINLESFCISNGHPLSAFTESKRDIYEPIFNRAVEKIMQSNKEREYRKDNIQLLRGISPDQAAILELSESGMSPICISLKLDIPFNAVMEQLETIPPMLTGDRLYRSEQKNEYKGNLGKTYEAKEKV